MAVVTAARPANADVRRDTQHAFDGVAATYDRSNSENALLCAMRARTRQALERLVAPGGHLLDLGCGPGTDIVHFAAQGFHVTGIDWSTAMIDEAARRISASGLAATARAIHLDIEQIDRAEILPFDRFDAAYSSFGPLNCVTDLPAAARAIAGRVRTGGFLVASVIGRICPWEIARYAGTGNWRRAVVRFARRPTPVPLEGRTVWTQYYTPRTFAGVFARAGFRSITWRALGLFTPPPYMSAFAGRHPAIINALQRIDDAVGAWPGIRGLGDHFLIAMRRS